ncbi:hypothetical protein Ait01nite_061990 [Actinoplanes italicus]|uniref:Uncharacterized protein n=1 Tax=Actinoplanes italicus TaxID=113567 RepID=A0A2T0K588_9ACTN|nr:DUF6401 family natural product biosynthesis protein [Actinoplanes italicus]PRX18062.1 hypothetical protein CLV67_114234 [Actinoplanes italicus]GIE33154.1 hypothetical protein Ait01nite_061990 [Actinoplanes italicus]
MNGLFSNAAARAAQRSAHASLADLTAAVGVSGLAAAQENPGLMSVIDQHAAGVRDSLNADSRPLTAILLAAYAEGVRDAAFQHGWTAPEDGIDWSDNDWVLRRLLAICMLARTLPAPR